MALRSTPAEFVSDGHVVLTGPIQGTVTTTDGTVYDVSAPVVEVAHLGHAAEVAALIGDRYQAEGHPAHDAEHPFVHTQPTQEGEA